MTQTKLEKLKKQRKSQDWITIGYDQIPKEVFDRYGARPFEIMRGKMRKPAGKVWNNISFLDAKKEAEKMGFRLPTIQEMLVLLDVYKQKYPDNASCHHKEFLGIEELSYDEAVNYEFVAGPTVFIRGGTWHNGSSAGAFTLGLAWGTGRPNNDVGFRVSK